jgi:hypothetical protein
VEVGVPFLERTQSKLRERIKEIVKHRPELEHYFDDPSVIGSPALKENASRVEWDRSRSCREAARQG